MNYKVLSGFCIDGDSGWDEKGDGDFSVVAEYEVDGDFVYKVLKLEFYACGAETKWTFIRTRPGSEDEAPEEEEFTDFLSAVDFIDIDEEDAFADFLNSVIESSEERIHNFPNLHLLLEETRLYHDVVAQKCEKNGIESYSTTKSLMEKYYRESFSRNLSRWFRVEKQRWNGCDFAPHMDGHFNPERPTIEDRNWYYDFGDRFSALVYLAILAQQLIWKVLGEDAACAFCQTNGWPIFSAGMGGFLHPIQMVSEADLLPVKIKDFEKEFEREKGEYFRYVFVGTYLFMSILPAKVHAIFMEEIRRLANWIFSTNYPSFPEPLIRLGEK